MDQKSQLANSPVMDVVAPPPVSVEAPEEPKETTPKTEKTPTKPQTSKEQSKGVGAAIFGTVVIVLSLAILAVFAYLKQN